MKRLLLCMIIISMIPLVLSVESLGTKTQYEKVELIQTCDNCTRVNLTTVQLPNNTIMIIDTNMTFNLKTYNYSFTTTDLIGNYIYTTCGDPDGVATCESVDFNINPAGNNLSTAESIIYIIFLLGLAGAFGLFLFFSITIPYKTPRGDDGKIISTNDLRFLKPVSMVFSWLLLMSFFGIMTQVTRNYLFLNGASKIFQWLYWFMLSFTFPAIVVSLIFILVMLVENQKIKHALLRGVPVR